MRADVRELARAFSQRSIDAHEKLTNAQARLAARQRALPKPTWDERLPITAHLPRIGELVREHPVVIVAGETGSGKTTQLPKLCLSLGFGARGMIGHTQPRRLAARAVAQRVADELATALGAEVGYAVRFTDRVSDATHVKVVTDGLLLTEIRRDRDLDAYEVLIVDEAHERSLNIDFLLGYVSGVLRRRNDFKLIVTSATIDVDAFASHFGGAPIVEVGGRGYPVDVRYLDDVPEDADVPALVLDALRDIATTPQRGARDVLVFLSGEREILDVARLLRRDLGDAFGGRFDVMPLYARLPPGEQQRIFASGPHTRIVLATNVAETSLTVPNIGFVVDSGRARISRYSYRSKLTRLHVEPISRASADQRKGRCGRIAPGTCLRLYSQSDFEARPPYTEPEILRTNLASVVLQMRAFRLGRIDAFPFLDPPEPKAIRDAERLLEELGALDGEALTEVGRRMARLPVDPRLARMLIAGAQHGALRELTIIVAALAVQDPRDRPLDKRDAADRAHREFDDPRSDFLAFVKLWAWYEAARAEMSKSALARECTRRFLSPMRMREWRDLHRQLLLACRDLGLKTNQQDADFASIHRAVLTGTLSQIGLKRDEGDYLGARGLKLRIFPGSALASSRPKWLVGAEVTDTGQTYARCVAAVEPRWIEEAAGHLVNRSHSEPQWNDKRGEVIAMERVVLYGIPLAERRPVSFKSIDPVQARAVFVRDGLVPGAVRTNAPFLVHNLALIAEVRDREARERRRDLLVTDGALAAFYEERLPDDVSDTASLERWRGSAERADPERLFMRESDVIRLEEKQRSEEEFPSTLEIDGVDLVLKYSFAPGARDDGVSVQVPLGMLNHLRAEPLEWLVPGLFAAKCEELVRGLPKALRRPLAPVPDALSGVVPLLLKHGVYRQGKLLRALADRIDGICGVAIPADAWAPEKLPPHLTMNVQVLDGRGRIADQDRDLDALKSRLDARGTQNLDTAARARYERVALAAFPDEVPEQIVLGKGDAASIVYPSLVDRGETVDLVLLPTRDARDAAMPDGCVRLAAICEREAIKQMRRDLKTEQKLGLHFASLGSRDQLHDVIVRATVWHAIFEGSALPRTAREFAARVALGRGQLINAFQRIRQSARAVLAKRFDLIRLLDQQSSPAYRDAIADVRRQVSRLVTPTFLIDTPRDRLGSLERYLDATSYRILHLQGKVEKDAQATREIRALEDRWDVLAAKLSDPDVVAARFALEELRIALFAQPLGTAEKTSPKRLEALLIPLEQRAGIR